MRIRSEGHVLGRLAVVTTLFFGISAAATGTAQATVVPAAVDVHSAANVSGKCPGVASGGVNCDKGSIQPRLPAPVASQLNSPGIQATYGPFEVRAQHSGKCLDVDNAYTYNGANVKQWSCAGVPQQYWGLYDFGNGFYELRAQHSGKCLDVDNAYTYNGANVKQWSCAGVPQQRWSLVYAG